MEEGGGGEEHATWQTIFPHGEGKNSLVPHFCSVWFGDTMCERVGDVQRPTFSELLNAKKRSFRKLEASVNLQIPLLF